MPATKRATTPASRAFLVRVWWSERDRQVKASLRDVDTGEVQAFTDAAELAEWLRRCVK